MGRSLLNAKLLASSFSDALSFSIKRRGYAGVSQETMAASGGLGRGGSRNVMLGKVEERAVIREESTGNGISCAWAPDPRTGYYRPSNSVAEIDPAELRAMLLNTKVRSL